MSEISEQCTPVDNQSVELFHQTSTVGENIIATIKMRNNFCYPFKMVIFRYRNIELFSIAPHLVIGLPTLR